MTQKSKGLTHMALKAVLDTLDGVPEALHEHYTERDGKFHLAAEGVVEKSRLDEFRNTNLTLKKQIEELQARFDGIDPEEARAAQIEAKKLRDKQLIEAGKVEELLSERVAAMRGEYEGSVKQLAESNAALTAQLEGLVIDNALRDAAAKHGVRASAIEDVLHRGKRVFKLDGAKAVAMDGDRPIYGKDGEPIGVGEWVNGLINTAPHLFETSTGSNAKASGTAGGSMTAGNGRVINKTNQRDFLANLEKIAKNQVRVVNG